MTTTGPPNPARIFQDPLTLFGWEIVHPLIHSDWHPQIFICLLKKFLGGKRHSNDDEVKQSVEKWLKGLAGEVYDMGV